MLLCKKDIYYGYFISCKTVESAFLFRKKKTLLDDSHLEIIPFSFRQTSYETEIKDLQKELTTVDFCPVTDDCISENTNFTYTVFSPDRKERKDKAIILLHGLNERSWDKYLTWAEYLATHTGRAVILFPIAFHMNRAPRIWGNPRSILPWVNVRKKEVQDVTNSTFVNVALSSRISKQPLRFYVSGLQSAYNIMQLVQEIKNGEHPLFKENTSVNIFAYSIGALLSQVLLLANPEEMFSESRLFMFCGGSIFSYMNGNARDILDKEASDRLMKYYVDEFLKSYPIGLSSKSISLEQAFKMMISPDVMRTQRESFFETACNRIQAISLKQDIVIPTEGVMNALGKASQKILEELDFSFTYSHQTPFPFLKDVGKELVNKSFNRVFQKASSFLANG